MRSKVGRKILPVPEFKSYISDHLDEAIEKDWIEVWYQPIVRSMTGEICAVEALARWKDPTYGTFLPPSFLEILEEENKTWKLDYCILLKVCKDITKRRMHKRRILPVSMNLSGKDFERQDFHFKINEILQNYHISHELLAIEISDTILPGNEEFFEPHLKKFREDGFSLWLDDFGSWYDSSSMLAQRLFDVIKLDLSSGNFLKPQTQELALTAIYMAKELGIGISAEKVENEFQYNFLKHAGCDRMQGYFIEKPAPLHENGMFANEQKFSYENREDLFFYNDIGKVNFLSDRPLGQTNEEAEFETPLAILEMQDQQGRLRYANESFAKMLQEFALESVADFGKWINHSENNGLYEKFRGALKEASESQATASFDFVSNHEHGQIYLKKIADNQRRQGFLLRLNHLKDQSAAEEKTEAAQSVRERTQENPFSDPRSSGKDAAPEEQGITAQILWNTFSQESSIGMFWKDTHRRFLGVNQMFLDYYGLDSEEQVLGKTDEDIGWHINPGPFRDDEIRVLHEGVRTVNVPGICIIRGEKRNIAASKMPIYENGKIVGLLGYFRDVTSKKIEQQKNREITSKDDITGLLNTRGLAEVGKDYEESYFRYSRDFMYVLINFQNLRQFNDTYGHFKGNLLLKKIAERLRKSVGINGVIAHLGSDEFVVMKQFGSMSEINEVKRAVKNAIYGIHEISGIAFTITFLMSAVIFSDFENYDVMSKAAEGQILEEQRNDRF